MRFKSDRNHGYGKQIKFAGKNAVREAYACGHFETVATHVARWNKFCKYLGEIGIRDTRLVTAAIVVEYAQELRVQVLTGLIKPSYSVNLLSSVNTVIQIMRGNRAAWVAPSAIASISGIRTNPPSYERLEDLDIAVDKLIKIGRHDLAAMVKNAYSLGPRFREAVLTDAKLAAKDAERNGNVSFERGTKGGQMRQVPVISAQEKESISFAKSIQKGNSFILPDETYIQFKRKSYRDLRLAGVKGKSSFKELRTRYACNKYIEFSGHLAPIQGGNASPEKDLEARLKVSKLLGHHRPGIVASYCGGSTRNKQRLAKRK